MSHAPGMVLIILGVCAMRGTFATLKIGCWASGGQSRRDDREQIDQDAEHNESSANANEKQEARGLGPVERDTLDQQSHDEQKCSNL